MQPLIDCYFTVTIGDDRNNISFDTVETTAAQALALNAIRDGQSFSATMEGYGYNGRVYGKTRHEAEKETICLNAI